MPAAVVDEVRLLQRAGHQRYAVAARADHLRHRFLGQLQLVAAGQVARLQQAPRQPGLHRVRGVAARGLLNLRIDRQSVPSQRGAEGCALVGRRAKLVDVDRRGHPGYQHHRAVERDGVAEGGERTEYTVAADHRDLNVLAACELDHQRNHAAVREVSAFERLVDFNQDHLLMEIGGAQMWADQFKIVRSQRRQKSIR